MDTQVPRHVCEFKLESLNVPMLIHTLDAACELEDAWRARQER